MANLVYRKSSTPSTNATTAFKGSPLTNDELDGNFFGIDAEVFTKAPKNNATLTGLTSIEQISCASGSINNTTIGFTTASTGKFSTLQATSDLTIGLNLLTTSTTCNIANTTATAVNFAGQGSTVTIGATTGTTTIRNANLAITGSVAVGSGPAKFTVNSANGNTGVIGTLDVSGTTTLAGLTAGAGGFTSLTSSGTLGVDGASTLNSLGVTNLATLGSLAVTGSSTFSNNVTLQGSSTASTEYFKINNGASVDKFTVDSANGNTVISGTLNVSGTTTLAGLTAAAGGFTSLTSSGNITVTGDILPTAATFNLVNATATTVNFAGAGTAVNIGALTGTGITTIKNALTVTGATTLSGDLAVTGNVNVGASKFTVNATTGNTTVVGTLGVTDSATFSSNVTLVGSSTAATKYFKIKDGASVDKFTVDSANGNTVVLGTLGVTNTITGPSLTSTVTTGTAPLTVASTTKVTNLNADRVDDISFTTTSIDSGGIPYVQSTAAGNHVINFVSGTSGTILYSSGAGAPTWALPTGLSAGSSYASTHLNNSTGNGDTYFQSSVTTNLTTTISSTTATVSSTSGIFGGMLISGNANVPNTADTRVATIVNATTLTLTVAATASGTVSTTFYRTNPLTIGAANSILTSSGTAPQWVTPSTVTVGTASLATNISAGTAGQLLYQSAANTTSKLTIGAANTILTSSGTSPQWSSSLTLGGTLGVDGASTLNSLGVTNAATVGTTLTVTGAATFSSNVTLNGSSTAATEYFKINNGASVDKFTVDSANGNTVISGTLNVSGNTTLTGTLAHGGLSPSAGSNVDQLVTVIDNLSLPDTSWKSTSVNFAELTTGSYIVQVSTGTEYYTGIMSWYAGDTSLTLTDEIILHRASAGSETSNLFLKIERLDSDLDPFGAASPNMTLQISSSVARVTATNYTFKFRRMI